jgi:hypothetical protein
MKISMVASGFSVWVLSARNNGYDFCGNFPLYIYLSDNSSILGFKKLRGSFVNQGFKHE